MVRVHRNIAPDSCDADAVSPPNRKDFWTRRHSLEDSIIAVQQERPDNMISSYRLSTSLFIPIGYPVAEDIDVARTGSRTHRLEPRSLASREEQEMPDSGVTSGRLV